MAKYKKKILKSDSLSSQIKINKQHSHDFTKFKSQVFKDKKDFIKILKQTN